jgi:hypothetical protein
VAQSQQGLCRRAPPVLSPINPKAYFIEGVWPTVRDDDWCGEWKVIARRTEARAGDAPSATVASAMAPAGPHVGRIGAAMGGEPARNTHGGRVPPLMIKPTQAPALPTADDAPVSDLNIAPNGK